MILLFCAVVGVLVAGSHLGYYALLRREIQSQMDRELQGAAAPVLRDLISEPNSQDINEFNLVDEYFALIDSAGRVGRGFDLHVPNRTRAEHPALPSPAQ
jgi:hypothetical protein